MQAMKDQSKAKGPNFTITKKDLAVGQIEFFFFLIICNTNYKFFVYKRAGATYIGATWA